jgi:hypothetical protein
MDLSVEALERISRNAKQDIKTNIYFILILINIQIQRADRRRFDKFFCVWKGERSSRRAGAIFARYR